MFPIDDFALNRPIYEATHAQGGYPDPDSIPKSVKLSSSSLFPPFHSINAGSSAIVNTHSSHNSINKDDEKTAMALFFCSDYPIHTFVSEEATSNNLKEPSSVAPDPFLIPNATEFSSPTSASCSFSNAKSNCCTKTNELFFGIPDTSKTDQFFNCICEEVGLKSSIISNRDLEEFSCSSDSICSSSSKSSSPSFPKSNKLICENEQNGSLNYDVTEAISSEHLEKMSLTNLQSSLSTSLGLSFFPIFRNIGALFPPINIKEQNISGNDDDEVMDNGEEEFRSTLHSSSSNKIITLKNKDDNDNIYIESAAVVPYLKSDWRKSKFSTSSSSSLNGWSLPFSCSSDDSSVSEETHLIANENDHEQILRSSQNELRHRRLSNFNNSDDSLTNTNARSSSVSSYSSMLIPGYKKSGKDKIFLDDHKIIPFVQSDLLNHPCSKSEVLHNSLLNSSDPVETPIQEFPAISIFSDRQIENSFFQLEIFIQAVENFFDFLLNQTNRIIDGISSLSLNSLPSPPVQRFILSWHDALLVTFRTWFLPLISYDHQSPGEIVDVWMSKIRENLQFEGDSEDVEYIICRNESIIRDCMSYDPGQLNILSLGKIASLKSNSSKSLNFRSFETSPNIILAHDALLSMKDNLVERPLLAGTPTLNTLENSVNDNADGNASVEKVVDKGPGPNDEVIRNDQVNDSFNIAESQSLCRLQDFFNTDGIVSSRPMSTVNLDDEKCTKLERSLKSYFNSAMVDKPKDMSQNDEPQMKELKDMVIIDQVNNLEEAIRSSLFGSNSDRVSTDGEFEII